MQHSNGSTDVLIKQGSLFLGLLNHNAYIAGPIMALLAGGPDDGGAPAAPPIVLQDTQFNYCDRYIFSENNQGIFFMLQLVGCLV